MYVERISLPDVDVDAQGGGLVSPTLTLKNGKPRPWHVDLGSATGPCVWMAAVAAVPIVIFFFFDQNVSSVICQKPEMKLSKGSYFHSSFLCMGIFNVVGPVYGLPFVTGSLPHSPQLVSALTTDPNPNPDRGDRGEPGPDDQDHDADHFNGHKSGSDRLHVSEQRLAPFLIYLLIGLSLVAPFGRCVYV